VAEMVQSLRISEQCVKNMPAGDYKADHPHDSPTQRRTMVISKRSSTTSWESVGGRSFRRARRSWGSATKGNNRYYLISDGSTMSYRTRIRSPSFQHLHDAPAMSRGFTVADMLAVIGSIDFVLADVDR
jgi:NADH-quinone oxidoreductase subunit C/D